jgi:hypothetical protein
MNRQRLKSGNDQCVTGKNGDALTKLGVHRGLASPFIGIVETGQVIMHQ